MQAKFCSSPRSELTVKGLTSIAHKMCTFLREKVVKHAKYELIIFLTTNKKKERREDTNFSLATILAARAAPSPWPKKQGGSIR